MRTQLREYLGWSSCAAIAAQYNLNLISSFPAKPEFFILIVWADAIIKATKYYALSSNSYYYKIDIAQVCQFSIFYIKASSTRVAVMNMIYFVDGDPVLYKAFDLVCYSKEIHSTDTHTRIEEYLAAWLLYVVGGRCPRVDD
ncbi:uncharacterized protein H6S33_011770 [Morchella sextelata]|uniref:uncharacterized protein n=1 Tax=Morchella sextelata TaxID=1174677 RepID=UPI001D0379AE|nr:uncharacterized protein H6S33_011770 [Morchella sextelata]KAH0610243.1 hypothetical protein H6S33_011770 [Morchella sextelata]